MSPDDALAITRAQVNENGQTVYIRRYSGTGPSRTKVDTATMAYVKGFSAKEIIGAIVYGDQIAVTLVDSLTAILPIRTTDKLVVGDAEYAIKSPLARVVGGVLIAIDIHAAGPVG